MYKLFNKLLARSISVFELIKFQVFLVSTFPVCRRIKIDRMMTKNQFKNLRAVVAHYRYNSNCPLEILEIGTWVGGSAILFANARPFFVARNKVTCVDLFNGSGITVGKLKPRDLLIKNDTIYDSLVDHINKYSSMKNFSIFKGNSKDVAAQISPNSKFDIFLIDGDHSYEGARSDFENYKKFLKPGALVIFDDCHMDALKDDEVKEKSGVANFVAQELFFHNKLHFIEIRYGQAMFRWLG